MRDRSHDNAHPVSGPEITGRVRGYDLATISTQLFSPPANYKPNSQVTESLVSAVADPVDATW